MFDRQRLADILRNAGNGDARDLAEEVVRLMGAHADADDELRRLRAERDLWRSDASLARAERDKLAAHAARALEAVPKTRRAELAELAELLEAAPPA